MVSVTVLHPTIVIWSYDCGDTGVTENELEEVKKNAQ